ncbi:hypothetical protein V6C42_07945 [Pseudoclostridium thermosuccinogenes]|uniref:hypothetical protein n=1 Tax=Clostridium thermosuccinogenes TaxID=84032 RepID=UPI002FDA858E
MPVNIKDAKVITYAVIQMGTGNEMPGESIIKSFKEKNDGYKNPYYNNYYLPWEMNFPQKESHRGWSIAI